MMPLQDKRATCEVSWGCHGCHQIQFHLSISLLQQELAPRLSTFIHFHPLPSTSHSCTWHSFVSICSDCSDWLFQYDQRWQQWQHAAPHLLQLYRNNFCRYPRMPEARNEDHSINRNWLGGIIMVLSPRNIYVYIYIYTFNIHHHMSICSNYVAYIYLFIHLPIKDFLYIYLLIKYLFARAFNQQEVYSSDIETTPWENFLYLLTTNYEFCPMKQGLQKSYPQPAAPALHWIWLATSDFSQPKKKSLLKWKAGSVQKPNWWGLHKSYDWPLAQGVIRKYR